MVSSLAFPFVQTASFFGAVKFVSQYIVRGILGLLVCLSFVAFRRAVQQKLGTAISTFLILITVSQFHFLFYASRPLPNTFALILALLAFRYWLMQQHGPFIWVSGAAVIIFRSELSILLGIILLLEIGGRRLGVWRAVGHIVPAGAVWLSR